MNGPHQHSKHTHHVNNANQGHGSSAHTPQEQRREFLWRERVRLELQVQTVIARNGTLAQQWQHLQARKAALSNQVLGIATQIVFASVTRLSQLPAERAYHYQRERIVQEEHRIQQEIISCNADAAALQSQIAVLDFELSLL
ncbi:MAG TPA: hypothetical protein VJ761_15315 [Ktedonobacteraceae bacterium]|nr:hypothetical protein [Ktedonobacteraceae bacterium]